MSKRSASIFGVLALVAGVLAFAAPAHAAAPFQVQQLQPNDTETFGGPCGGSTNCYADALSDKFDGTDSLAHLTAVATSETTQVTWYACPLATPDAPTNADLANCTITIGTDTEGVIPTAGPAASSPSDKAFEVNWDIPSSLDLSRRDIVVAACIGTAQNVSGPSQNCKANVQHNIFLEDAGTGVALNQTTSGEMNLYRTGAADPSCGATP
ncbi:MAG: hypothetical protein QOH90_2056, partial [Actinomycetota bacterium]|nr:hypothetical protein [Actinomycetota bacterium]